MNLNDLYENREPYQQAIDKLEARRIEDLEAKMDDLAIRAKESTDPKVKEALRHEFARAKAERDSYYKLNVEEELDTNYTYTVYIDGTKEGTYGSKEEAKAVVNRKKEQAPGRDYRIKPKARTSIASIKRFNRNRDREIEEHGGGVNDAGSYVKWRRSANKERGITKQQPVGKPAVEEWKNSAAGEPEQDDLVKVEGYATSIASPDMTPLNKEKQWKLKIRQLVADYIKNPQGLYNIAQQRGPSSPEAYAYNQIMHPTGKLQVPSTITFEGWSNKMVARRTGTAPTPYSVYISGKEWKSFDDDDHAENVANKLRAKFKEEGKDPSVITIAPTSYDKDLKEFAPSPERGDNGDEVPNQILTLANRWWNSAGNQPRIESVLRSLGWSIHQVEGEDDAVQLMHNDGTTYFISADDFDPDLHEDSGSWIVYDPETRQIKKRFKTHTAGKSYARAHNLGFASSEYYFDNVKQAVAEDGEHVDPILYKALERIPKGIQGKGTPGDEVWKAAKIALATEYGLLKMKHEYATAGTYLNKLIDMYLGQSVTEGWAINPEHLKGPRSMKAAAKKPTGPKFSGYLKGTDPAPNEYTNKGVGGCEESEEMEEGIAGNITARSDALTQPIRKRNFVAKNAQISGAGKHNNNLKAAAARGQVKHKGKSFELDEITDDDIAKLRKDAEAGVQASLNKQSNDRIAALKNPPKEKSFLQKVGDKQIGMVKGAWKGLTGQLEESDNFLTWAVRNGYNINKPSVYESARQEFNVLIESKKKIVEKWSEKYKRSINCSHPKGFSQKAHCAGKKKNEDCGPIAPHETYYGAMDETKKIGTRVQIIKGSAAGQTGTIGEIRLGAYKGAPGYYTVDLDNGGHIQVRKEALRVIGINESLKNNEYYVWTVYFDDGSSKRIKVKSDEFDPYEYYAKQNKVVVNVDYSWDIHQ